MDEKEHMEINPDAGPEPVKKKKWKKELGRKLTLALAPPFAEYWMRWCDYTYLKNDGELLTAIGTDEMVERVGSHQNPSIIATWHNRLMLGPMAYQFCHGKGIVVMVSRSFDGEIIAATMSRFKNMFSARGSSRSKKGRDKGGHEAFTEMLEWAAKGYDLCITPDGPQGPPYKVKRGVIDLAKLTGFPIIPGIAQAEKRFRIKSWDRTIVPLPYSRVIYRAEKMITVPPDADEAVIEQKRAELERVLIEITEYVDGFYQKV